MMGVVVVKVGFVVNVLEGIVVGLALVVVGLIVDIVVMVVGVVVGVLNGIVVGVVMVSVVVSILVDVVVVGVMLDVVGGVVTVVVDFVVMVFSPVFVNVVVNVGRLLVSLSTHTVCTLHQYTHRDRAYINHHCQIHEFFTLRAAYIHTLGGEICHQLTVPFHSSATMLRYSSPFLRS